MTKNNIFLRFNGASGSMTLSCLKPIPQQTITVRQCAIEFDTDAHNKACKFIKINANWMGGSTLSAGKDVTDNTFTFYVGGGMFFNTGNSLSGVTAYENLNINLDMSQDCPLTFDYNIQGIDLTGFTELRLAIEYDEGRI